MVNRYELVLILGLFLLLIYMAFRIRALFKNRSKKFFHGFWFWVVPWLLFLNAIPFWLCRPYLPRTVLLVGLLATLLDFFYFYGLKSKDSARTQWLSLLWLVPILAVGLGARMGSGRIVAPPHHGPALVWTDRIYNPEIYFFLDRQTRGTDQIGEAFEDPNYGKAIFSPINGEIVSFNDGFLTLKDAMAGEGLVLSIGPFIPDSVTVKPGERCVARQPLGLAGRGEGDMPGIQIRIIEGGPLRFQQVVAGRFFGAYYDDAALLRNQIVMFSPRH